MELTSAHRLTRPSIRAAIVLGLSYVSTLGAWRCSHSQPLNWGLLPILRSGASCPFWSSAVAIEIVLPPTQDA